MTGLVRETKAATRDIIGDMNWDRLGRSKRWFIDGCRASERLLGKAAGRLLNGMPLRVKVAAKEQVVPAAALDYAPRRLTMVVDGANALGRLGSCAKEPETVAWLEQHLKAGDVFYDVGANVGAYSLVAFASTRGGIRIYAFEPASSTFAALTANIVLNGASTSIVPLPVALSDDTGTDRLHYAALSPGAAEHWFSSDLEPGGDPVGSAGSVTVLRFRLDDLATLLELPAPNVMKIDVDGTEMRVLHGATRTIASPLLRTVMIEVSAETSEPVTEFLKGYGFDVDGRWPRRTPGDSNYLFVRHPGREQGA